MNSIESIILGTVQGLTEFLPVSSSGHLFLGEMYFGLTPSLAFELYLHIGTLIAVVVYFRRDLWQLLGGFARMVHTRTQNPDGLFALQLGVATILTFPTALVVKQLVLDEHLSVGLVAGTLLVTAGLILVSEYMRPQTERNLTWTIVCVLGLVQGLALIPGISRSGLTIAFLLLVGVNRQLSARTSFLLSIPTIIGAGIFAYIDSSASTDMSLSLPIVLGVLTSAGVGYLGIKWMMRLVEGRWVIFVPYCVLLSIGILFFV